MYVGAYFLNILLLLMENTSMPALICSLSSCKAVRHQPQPHSSPWAELALASVLLLLLTSAAHLSAAAAPLPSSMKRIRVRG